MVPLRNRRESWDRLLQIKLNIIPNYHLSLLVQITRRRIACSFRKLNLDARERLLQPATQDLKIIIPHYQDHQVRLFQRIYLYTNYILEWSTSHVPKTQTILSILGLYTVFT
jgi:hypothetical protein